jgi:hypothetical protein
MEKLIYALWRDESTLRTAFNAELLGPVAKAILPHVRGLRINVQEESVAGGNSARFVVTDPQMEAVVQIWVDSAYAPARAPIEAALTSVSPRIEGWLVSESAPLPNRAHPPQPGKATEGFSQVVFFERPADLPFETWQRNWQNDHTVVAVETQSTFEYVQHLVVRPVTEGAAPYAAFVEECFPMAALTDPEAFYDAVGVPGRLEANYARMMASCGRFMGPAGGDCIPTRQYDIKAAWAVDA